MAEKRLENLLNPSNNGELGDIVRHAREMGELVRSLQGAVPAETGHHILAANVRDDGELVILASSPAWAAKLRFEAEALLQAARDAHVDATSCKVRVSRDP